MPQGPIQTFVVNDGGNQSALNITAASVIKASPGRLATISVLVAGSAAGAAYDSNKTAGVGVSNQIAVIPDAAGTVAINWPCQNGIVVVPGTGQTIAVTFN